VIFNPECTGNCLTVTGSARQGRIKASAGPGAVPNADPLQAYNQLAG